MVLGILLMNIEEERWNNFLHALQGIHSQLTPSSFPNNALKPLYPCHTNPRKHYYFPLFVATSFGPLHLVVLSMPF